MLLVSIDKELAFLFCQDRKETYSMNCKNCGKRFNQKRSEDYCSIDCKKESMKLQQVFKLKPKKCKICNIIFQPKNVIQKYCSIECQKKSIYLWYEKTKKQTYFKVFERDSFRCVYCGRSPLTHKISLVVDHVYSRKHGGQNDLFNLATCCEDCNKYKAANLLGDQLTLKIWEELNNRNKKISKYKDLIKLYFDNTYQLK